MQKSGGAALSGGAAMSGDAALIGKKVNTRADTRKS